MHDSIVIPNFSNPPPPTTWSLPTWKCRFGAARRFGNMDITCNGGRGPSITQQDGQVTQQNSDPKCWGVDKEEVLQPVVFKLS